jgi:GNAT superfamily N-acetyltransferase
MYEPLIDGAIRKLWIGEADSYRDHLVRLDPESRRNRFGATVSAEFIAKHVEDSIEADAIIHGYFVDGVLRGAGELRPLRARRAREAEAAFSVERPWQSLGVGTALLARTLLAARNRGLKHLHMTCLADNRRMQQLARKFDAALTFDFGSVVGEVAASQATPMSVMRELLVDGHDVATAMLEAQSRLLRTA